MKKKSRSFTITLKTKKPAIGHYSHRSGGGTHDNRPRKQRTKTAQKNAAIRDFF
jgi:hypothetical protein|tara:strand:- start:854 stop:1015 length:162 start_codon:yes stop_codon:yes gene_type:complete